MCKGEGGTMELIHVYGGGGTKDLIWGRGTMELIHVHGGRVTQQIEHVYGGGGTRELICVCVCGWDKEVIHVGVEVGPSTICVCGRGTRNYYMYVRDPRI